MALTNFPQGVSSLGIPVLSAGGADIGAIPVGPQYWFVSSATGSDGYDGSWDQPFATLQKAADMCTASLGDVIVIKPGHAETLISAGIVTLSKAGVRVVGLGQDSNRPIFTFSTSAAASILISGANVSIKNIVGVAGINSLTKPFDITGSGAELDIEWRDGTYEAQNIVRGVSIDRLKIRLRDQGLTGGSLRHTSILLDGATETEIFIDQYGKASTAIVNFVTDACLGVRIYGFIYNQDTTDGSKTVIDSATSSKWYCNVFDGTAGAQFDGGSGSTFGVAATDLTAVTNALYGAAGITTWAAGAAAASGVSISESLRYAQENIINGSGTALPTNMSLYGVLAGATGIVTWPTPATYATTVSMAAVLAYIQNAVRNGTGTGMGTNKGVADALGTNGVTIVDSAVSVLGAIGADNNNNAFASTSIVSNADGSVLERLEYLQVQAGSTPATYFPGLGYKVSKVEDLSGTTVDLFTVTGKCYITLWSGEVTNALDAAVTDYKIRVKTDNIDLCAASNIGSAAVGFLFQMCGDAGDTLINTASAVKTADVNGKGMTNRIVGLASGTGLVLQSLHSAGASGDSITHTIWYMPLEAGAGIA